MGTVASIVATTRADDGQRLRDAVDRAVAWLHEVDDRFTTWRPGSEWLSYVDGELALADAHPDLRFVVERADALARETDGAFSLTADPDRPPDPAAYVKGWAVQRAADIVAAGGADGVCVNGGGDVAVWRAQGTYRVGIADPFQPGRIVGTVELADGAVATSGTYERGAHIFDASSGRPVQEFASVTVVGPDLGTADAYATAAFAMGERALGWLASIDAYGAFVVHKDGRTETVGLRTAMPVR